MTDDVFKRLIRIVFLTLVIFAGEQAAAGTLKNTRLWHSPDGTRVVFDLDGPVQFKSDSFDSPPRIAIDVTNGRIRGRLPGGESLGPLISRIRSGQFNSRTLRVVFDLSMGLKWKVFMLKPGGGYGYRLVVDLFGNLEKTGSTTVASRPKAAHGDIIIAIDPGHGGDDPGAIGPRGTKEKDVVLSIARVLAKKIDAVAGMRAVLTRNGDYYVNLRRRIQNAREKNADIFVSIHADAVKSRKAKGSSVYALSQKGATSETAKLLAQKENLSDLAGGVTLKDKDDPLAYVLLDLSMTQTVSDSLNLAADVLKQLRRIGSVHSRRVEQAGFVVLKSPDVPSVLVETAYISNPREEKLLRSKSHQNKVAGAILAGIRTYLKKYPLKG